MSNITAEIVTGPAPPSGGLTIFPPERTSALPLTKDAPACLRAGLQVQAAVRPSRIDPPIPGGQQKFCLHSFTPAPGATPDPDGVFGIVRFRGSFMTEHEADEWAGKLLRDVDSNTGVGVYVGYVGRDFPLTAQSLDFVPEVREHDLRQKMDAVARERARQAQDEEAKTRRDIEERQAALCAPPDPHYETSLRYYTTLQVKVATLRYHCDEMERKRAEFEKLREQTVAVIAQLGAGHPDYRREFVDAYTKEIESVGLQNSPLLPYLLEQQQQDEQVQLQECKGEGSS